MIVIVALVVLWASYELANRLRDRAEGVARVPVAPRRSTTATRAGDDANDTVTWSALDDHQLTRLLTQSSSPRTDTHDDVPGL